jgi:hypothetical protein
MKNILLLSLVFFITAVNATQITDEELKTSGRALANYHLCADIAKKQNDSTMYYYYNEMYDDSLLGSKMLPIWQVQVIFDEQQKSRQKLAKIDKNSFEKLCLSRFDELTRKIYETKMEAEIKENAASI